MQPVHPRFSLNQLTIRQWSTDQVITACAERGVPALALWRHLVEEIGLETTVRMLADTGLAVSSLCRGGFFPAPTAAERRERIDDSCRAVDEAVALNADILLLVCGAADGLPLPEARAVVRDGIEALLPFAAEAGMTLGIEPFHPMMIDDRSVIVTLQEANDLVAYFDDPHLGVVIDSYHVFWDPRLDEEMQRADGKIVSYQISDWVLPIAGGLSSRGMMGEGSIDLARITWQVEDLGYRGAIEVEIFSDDLWAGDPSALLEQCIERFAEGMEAAGIGTGGEGST